MYICWSYLPYIAFVLIWLININIIAGSIFTMVFVEHLGNALDILLLCTTQYDKHLWKVSLKSLKLIRSYYEADIET